MPQSVTARMQKILHRTHQLRRRRIQRSNFLLSTACLLLTAEIAALLHQRHLPGVSVVLSGYSSVLLHSGTDAYIVVGILSFVIGVLFTLLCIRYKRRSLLSRHSSSDAADKASSPNKPVR